MATYAVGDIHGCYKTVRALLETVGFDGDRDRLWLVGDLVNRGPRSLKVLRWARKLSDEMGRRFVAVLGNHDLHLLALDVERGRRNHIAYLAEILEAPDRKELLGWLRTRPLLHREGKHLLVHAGLHPAWGPARAERKARLVEEHLRSRGRLRKLLDAAACDKSENGVARRKRARELAIFTGIRTCTPAGRLCDFAGPPEAAPEGCVPWFEIEGRKSRKVTVVAGHWAALGLRLEKKFIGLDTGCVYNGRLTAVRLEDRRVYSRSNRG